MIFFSIIGLKSLLEGAAGELRSTLSIRTSVLLECLVMSRSDIFDCVHKAYKIRTDFVHGTDTGEIDLSRLSSVLLRYLRFSILMWLELKSKKEEDEIRNNLLLASMQPEVFKEIKMKFKKPNEYCSSYASKIKDEG